MVYSDELYHHGILGMHWGHHNSKEPYVSKHELRKTQNEEYRKKMKAILKSKTAHHADVKAMQTVNKTFGKRAGEAFAKAGAATLISDLLSGEVKNYKNMNGTSAAVKFFDVGRDAVKNILVDELTAKSVAQKYNTNGDRIKGSNDSYFTREQVTKAGLTATKILLPIISKLNQQK